jgi:hypothetical protein
MFPPQFPHHRHHLPPRSRCLVPWSAGPRSRSNHRRYPATPDGKAPWRLGEEPGAWLKSRNVDDYIDMITPDVDVFWARMLMITNDYTPWSWCFWKNLWKKNEKALYVPIVWLHLSLNRDPNSHLSTSRIHGPPVSWTVMIKRWRSTWCSAPCHHLRSRSFLSGHAESDWLCEQHGALTKYEGEETDEEAWLAWST